MMEIPTVCCMCGDVGFPDKLFRCTMCRNRFQHSYCSNYYTQDAEPIELCDWCQTEQTKSASTSSARNFGVGLSSKRSGQVENVGGKKMIKQITDGNGEQKSKDHASGTPSPRTATRRYKLLKDVMC